MTRLWKTLLAAVGPDGRPVVGPDGKPLLAAVGPDGQPVPVAVGPDGKPLLGQEPPVDRAAAVAPAPAGVRRAGPTAELGGKTAAGQRLHIAPR